jgi:ribosomal protein S27AE
MKELNKNNLDCPKCGSRMVSNGAIRWRCTQCGYSPSKMSTERTLPDYSDRPPCPYCGEYHAIKHGASVYLCGECGRCYQKDWQDKPIEQEEIVIPASEAVLLCDY